MATKAKTNKKITKKRTKTSAKKTTKKKNSAKKKPTNKKVGYVKGLAKNKKIVIVAVALAVVLALIVAFAVTYTPQHQLYQFNKSVASGIDVSSHNGEIEWDTVKENVDFAFVRVGYRGYKNASLVVDKKAKYNLKYAHKAGVPVGVYFYSQAITEDEAKEEAEFVLSTIKGYKIDLPIAIDFEHAYDNGEIGGRLYEANLTKKQCAKIINAFCSVINKAGYTPAVYASTYFYNSIIDTTILNKSAIIWVADYNDEITYTGDYDIWQYSKTGKCDGVSSKNVDTNYWFTDK